MNISTILIGALFLAFVSAGLLLVLRLIRRNHTKQLKDQFGAEYDQTVAALGDQQKAQTELEARQKHVETLEVRSLSASERERYLADWAAVQFKFVDEPGQAITSADHLIMEVMQLRGYPVSDFEQRAADLSVNYPALVSHYRSARAIALKNEQQQVETEELRQAMLDYRSLFDELVETEAVVA